MGLITSTEKGLYCAQGDFYIDPWKPVPRALITHAHADHAVYGHQHYISTQDSVPILKYRLGQHIQIAGFPYRETFTINGVTISFHPAGHIFGSAQVKLVFRGEIWVFSGDYKTEDDTVCTPLEVVPCHTFISECTFGLPSFRWQPQQVIFDEINAWWRENKLAGKTSILCVYALGKAQRIARYLDTDTGDIYTHGAIQNTHDVLLACGMNLPKTQKPVNRQHPDTFRGSMVLAVPSALGSSWMKKFPDPDAAVVSGWMAMRGARRRRGVEKGFVLSDHADWKGLTDTIKQTGAERIYVTHGYTHLFARWLTEQGYQAGVMDTLYQDEPEQHDDPLVEVEES